MDFQTLVNNQTSEKLKCSKCHNYLSYFPISVSSKNENYCGRCQPINKNEIFHNVAFETLSQFIKFPCRWKNEGCTVEILPKKVPDHEKQCPFRVISCPVNDWLVCNWKGGKSDLLKHCRDEHATQYLKNEGSLKDILNGDKKLIEHDETILIFWKKYQDLDQVLQFGVNLNEFDTNLRKFEGTLTVTTGRKSTSLDFTTDSTDSIALSSMGVEGTYKLSIGDEIEDPDRILKVDMLTVLKCCLCQEYSIPPIYHCINNSETLCVNCKDQHQSACSTCTSNISSTRNINLDKIAHMLNYPCKNQQNGCTFIGKPDKIKSHQETCDLGEHECPLHDFDPCNWKSLIGELEEHIQNNHQELISNSTQLSKQLHPQRMKCDIIKFSNQMFRLVCVNSGDEKYMWTVQVIGFCEDSFKYEIEIIDPENKGRRLIVRQECGKLTKKAELFTNGREYCYFLKDQIGDFVVDRVVTFRVNIFV